MFFLGIDFTTIKMMPILFNALALNKVLYYFIVMVAS